MTVFSKLKLCTVFGSQSSHGDVPPVSLAASSPPVGSYTAVCDTDQKPAQGRDPSWDHCCSCFSCQPDHTIEDSHFEVISG